MTEMLSNNKMYSHFMLYLWYCWSIFGYVYGYYWIKRYFSNIRIYPKHVERVLRTFNQYIIRIGREDGKINVCVWVICVGYLVMTIKAADKYIIFRRHE